MVDIFDLFISSHPHIFISLGFYALACIRASLYPQIFSFICPCWHPCILISIGSCVLACIFASLHPRVLKFISVNTHNDTHTLASYLGSILLVEGTLACSSQSRFFASPRQINAWKMENHP